MLRRTPDFVPWLAWVVLAATVVAVVGLVLAMFRREVAVRLAAIGLAAAVIAGLAGPAAYAVTPLQPQVNGSNSTAGPSGGAGFGPRGGFRGMMCSGQNGQPPMTPPNGQDRQDGQS
ncbi:hypothetical protein AB0H88_09770 [Nonomuraea sp. NPDC050680]|uniref:hypothetical protein n=1 Tax=Nonomuraea sp. NPDC050680 TaxID=3154630 RepID=UPI0033EDD9F7